MAYEIERKFLVHSDRLPALTHGQSIQQGYICSEPERVVRVRVAGSEGFITVKGRTVGATRLEFEYPVPLADAQHMLKQLCEGTSIDKVRYCIAHQGHTWELDVFGGSNSGLIVAEVELKSENETVALPAWVSQEVTADTRYYNSNLLRNPYQTWSSE